MLENKFYYKQKLSHICKNKFDIDIKVAVIDI